MNSISQLRSKIKMMKLISKTTPKWENSWTWLKETSNKPKKRLMLSKINKMLRLLLPTKKKKSQHGWEKECSLNTINHPMELPSKPILLRRRNTTNTERKIKNTINTERKTKKITNTERNITAADSSKPVLLHFLLVTFTPSRNSSTPSPLSKLSVPTWEVTRKLANKRKLLPPLSSLMRNKLHKTLSTLSMSTLTRKNSQLFNNQSTTP